MSLGDKRLRDVLDEGKFGLKRSLRVRRETDPIGDTEDMGIDRHRRTMVDDRSDDISCLAPHPWELHQGFTLLGHLPLMVFDELLRGSDEVTRLGARIAHTTYQLEDIIYLRSCHDLCRRILAEETGRDHIDPLVRALSREDDRYEEFKGGGIVKLGLGHRHVFLEPCDHPFVALFAGHNPRA